MTILDSIILSAFEHPLLDPASLVIVRFERTLMDLAAIHHEDEMAVRIAGLCDVVSSDSDPRCQVDTEVLRPSHVVASGHVAR